jgi:hypothetical protein
LNLAWSLVAGGIGSVVVIIVAQAYGGREFGIL